MLKKLLLTIVFIVSNTCLAEALPNSSYGDAPDIPGLAVKCRASKGICPYSYIVWRKKHKESAFLMIYVEGNRAIILCDQFCSERDQQIGTRWIKLSELYLEDIQ
jgi:hypothetical protein